MTVLQLMASLIVVGLVLHLINAYIPMAPSIKTVLNVVVVVFVCLWLLEATGILPSSAHVWK